MKIKITKKTLIIAGAALFLTAATFTTIAIVKAKQFKVAFYGVGDELIAPLKEAIANKVPKSKFFVLKTELPLTQKEAKKYSAVFCWNGKTLDNLSEDAIAFPETFYNRYPSNIKKACGTEGKRHTIPLLLDYFELAEYKIAKSVLGLEIPETWEQLEKYLQDVKVRCKYPIVCAGSNDRELMGFVSAIGESVLGSEGYSELASDLEKNWKQKKEFPELLVKVLEVIDELQDKAYLNPRWYEATQKDADIFMEEHDAGIFAMTMEMHKRCDFVFVRDFETNPVPLFNLKKNHSLVAPMLCAVINDNRSETHAVVEYLASEEGQGWLSNETHLAPVFSHSETYDRRTTDIRYWAAAYPMPPVTFLDDAALTDPAAKKELAEAIRQWFRK